MAFTDKLVIDEFLDGSQMNSKIYQTLLFLQDNNDNGRAYIRVQPLAIFNHAYKVCDLVMAEPHPELLLDRLWHRSEEEFLTDEVNVVYCCVYVILSFTGSGNTGMVYFLTRLRQKIDYKYLSVFEPLLEEELTDFPALPKSFAKLKAQGAKIEDLNERELFYTEYLTRYKQARNKGNILKQIEDEIELTKRTRELVASKPESETPSSDSSTVPASKVRTAVIMEMLNKLGKGKSRNDLSKICRLVAFLTGGSEDKIYNDAQRGILLSKYHKKDIDTVNQLLAELDLEIKITTDKEY